MDDALQRSEEPRERSRFTFIVKLSGPVIIKVTGPALALVLVLALLVLTWYLSR
ncbi:hypothetical protein ILP97_21945 [Amycolatopsis sp. H6(2020)]|nr:hypothetical protein [Amycolatopsis sp. H6(2020)]